jgi:hypothetical protein
MKKDKRVEKRKGRWLLEKASPLSCKNSLISSHLPLTERKTFGENLLSQKKGGEIWKRREEERREEKRREEKRREEKRREEKRREEKRREEKRREEKRREEKRRKKKRREEIGE